MVLITTLAKRAGWVTWSGVGIATAYLVAAVLLNFAGPNPVEFLLNKTGQFALYLLMACLAITPVRALLNKNWMAPYRRELGLASAWFAFAHFTIYLVLDQGLDLSALVADAVKRPFIFLGLVAVLLMIPLVATSFKKTIKKVGASNWKRIHRLSYVIGVLAVAHYWLKVKLDVTEPVLWAIFLGGLFAFRIWKSRAAKTGLKAS